MWRGENRALQRRQWEEQEKKRNNNEWTVIHGWLKQTNKSTSFTHKSKKKENLLQKKRPGVGLKKMFENKKKNKTNNGKKTHIKKTRKAKLFFALLFSLFYWESRRKIPGCWGSILYWEYAIFRKKSAAKRENQLWIAVKYYFILFTLFPSFSS